MPRRTPKPLSSREVRRFLQRERLQNAERRQNNDLPTTPHSIFTDTATTPDTEPRISEHNSNQHQVSRRLEYQTENMEEADMDTTTALSRTAQSTSKKVAQVTPLSPWDGYIQEFPNSVVFNHRTIETFKYNINESITTQKYSIKTTALNNPLATATSLTWLDYCKDRYEYYSVLGCKYKITVYPNDGNTAFRQWHLFVEMDAGNDVIPMTDLSTPTPFNLLSSDFQLMGIYPKAELNHAYTGATVYVNYFDNRAVVKGLYKPRDFKKNIVDDDNAQLWTAYSADPPLEERINIFILRTPASKEAETTLVTDTMIVEIQLEYLTQWKDLKDPYQYQRLGTSQYV